MSILCDALLVFGLSTGAFCQQTATGVTQRMPKEVEPEPEQEPGA